MMQMFRKIFSLCCGILFCLPLSLQAQEGETVITQDQLGGRRALVGPGCLVNQFATNVQLLSGITGLENLVDEDLENYVTFTTGVAVGVTEQPLFSVKDMNHTYAAGTEAGICMISSESGGLLGLNVIQLFTIRAYNNGQLVGTYSVSSGQAGSGVSLDLIKIPGTDHLTVNMTCTPDQDFDELYVNISGGLDISAIKELKFKYAFVGKPRQCLMTDSGIREYAAETGQAGSEGSDAQIVPKGLAVPVLLPFPIIESELNKLVDDDLANSCSVTNVVSIGYKGAVKLSTDPNEPQSGTQNETPQPTVVFPAGSEVGFVYQNASALDLKLGNYVVIKVFNTDGTTQTERVEAGVLALTVAEGGKMISSVIAQKEFYAAEIAFYTGVSANLGNLGVYYGFVNEPVQRSHRCPINSSVNMELCTTQNSYQLISNPALSVEWKLISAKEYGTENELPEGDIVVTSSGMVSFRTGTPCICEFEATSVGCTHVPKCTERVVIYWGVSSQTYEESCTEPIYNKENDSPTYQLSDEIYDSSGSLISISDLQHPEYILDNDLNNYATYEKGLSIASNLRVIGVKSVDRTPFSLSTEATGNKVNKRVGFIVETKSTFLNADVLQFFQIRCYRNEQEVYRKLVDDSNAVGVGLIGEEQSQKLRLSIEVPADVEFDEFMLWTAGVLKVDISVLNIYYPFIEDATLDCASPLKCAEVISTDHGATAYPDMKFQTASIAGVVQNLGYLVDNDPDSYFLYQNTVQAGSGMVVTIKLGKTIDYRHQFGIIMDSQTFLAGVSLGNWLTVETYYNGQPTGDKFTNWGVLGLDVIGYGDKCYLVNTPSRNFDEVRLTFASVANVLNAYKVYGLFVRGDKNLNGIPDCMDPEQDCKESLNWKVGKVCVGDNLYISGFNQSLAGQNIYILAPEQSDDKFEVSIDDWGEFELQIPTSKAGNALNLIAYNAEGEFLDGTTYTVHPKQAEWRKNPVNTDWNEPNNWVGNVAPYCCTNVIIPEGATLYPVLDLQGGDSPGTGVAPDILPYCCDGIYFQSSVDAEEDNPAQIINIPELAYHKAWVDVRMMPNRYYLFSAPLKNTYTGDLFVPEDMKGVQTGHEFEDLTQENNPQNRLNPAIYQRMWKTNPTVRLLDKISYSSGAENRDDVYQLSGMETTESQMADWSKVFNRMTQKYSSGQGFSVWIDNGDLAIDVPVIMRLPKQHTVYNYYTPDGVMLPEYDGSQNTSDTHYSADSVQLERTDNSRFIYEENEKYYQVVDSDYPDSKSYIVDSSTPKFTVQAITEAGTNSFVVGNPFMSDVDIKTFLEENPDIEVLRRYDGNIYSSYVLDQNSSKLVSNDPNGRKPVIHPLESFFVDLEDAVSGNKTDIFFNPEMMLSVDQTNTLSAGDEVPLMRLVASVGGQKASILLADSLSDYKVESLLDSDVKPSLAIFAALDNKAYDMLAIRQSEIPLGVIAGVQDTLTLQVSETLADLSDWVLVDQKENCSYPLTTPIIIPDAGISVGRFVLKSRSHLATQDISAPQLYASYSGNGMVQVTATKGTVASLEAFSSSGLLYGKTLPHTASAQIQVPTDSVVLVRATSDNGTVVTWKMMIPAF